MIKINKNEKIYELKGILIEANEKFILLETNLENKEEINKDNIVLAKVLI